MLVKRNQQPISDPINDPIKQPIIKETVEKIERRDKSKIKSEEKTENKENIKRETIERKNVVWEKEKIEQTEEREEVEELYRSKNDPIKNSNNDPKNDPIKSLRLSRREQAIYNYIKAGSHMNRNDMAMKLKCSEATVKRAVVSLTKKGLIVREGSNKTGYWRVV